VDVPARCGAETPRTTKEVLRYASSIIEMSLLPGQWQLDLHHDARLTVEATDDGALIEIQLVNGVVYQVEVVSGNLSVARGNQNAESLGLRRRPGRAAGARDLNPRTRRWPKRPPDETDC